ncbi:DeoR/GlpR family DNA-binding transcription regulator [Lachnoclostridium sp. Marseille-P6806]|uniref:DeoR/GlpR family DNA-binding transcription regulator n=1 Tax=Lachnoclostridium sp. Marseille-P6806 TaxID=2364793 RepID=UPI001030FC73|nr:DeoR/GlpR family DNA-binding transcription regulator [Lachnoclostridium sp. Marseille-P6806]
MFTNERQNRIEEQLRRDGKVVVKELSEQFGVTEDCIRKDLKQLENGGRLKRTYGGAILSQEYPLERDVVNRKDFHLEQKRKVAQKAFTLLREGETIFLDISTTNIELAKLIAASEMRLTAVSNMIDILQILAMNRNLSVIGTGGVMNRGVNGFLGSSAIDAIRQYSFEKAFMGCCGIDFTDGSFTTLGVEDGLTKRAAIECARHEFVVMEREKFYFNENYRYAHLDDIGGIITDALPDGEICSTIAGYGVELYSYQ